MTEETRKFWINIVDRVVIVISILLVISCFIFGGKAGVNPEICLGLLVVGSIGTVNSSARIIKRRDNNGD